eukprot:63594-Alexandrium_andersonii.AAC.1
MCIRDSVHAPAMPSVPPTHGAPSPGVVCQTRTSALAAPCCARARSHERRARMRALAAPATCAPTRPAHACCADDARN